MARILVAEDDPEIAYLVCRALATRGHDAVHAADGIEALERCRRQHFDVLVFDIRMPGLTGLEVADQLRREGLLRWSPLVLLTAQPAETHAELGYAIGARVYVTKPFRVSELLDTVDELLQSRMAPSEPRSGAMEEPRTIETYVHDDGSWRNRFVDGRTIDGVHRSRKAAALAGSSLAATLNVPHQVVYAARR